MKKSPLHPLHQRLGADMIQTAGWYMPRQYTDLIHEHLAARAACGLFDISHLGKFRLVGKNALDWLEAHLSNSVANCLDGQIQQTLMLQQDGVILDRMTLLRENNERFFLIGSASLADADFDNISRQVEHTTVNILNETDSLCILALTGPDSKRVIAATWHEITIPSPGEFRTFRRGNQRCMLLRAGLLSSDSMELICPSSAGITWFEQLMAAGAVPCGQITGEYLRIRNARADMENDIGNLTPAAGSLQHLCAESKEYRGAEAVRNASTPTHRMISLRSTSPGMIFEPGSEIRNNEGHVVGNITSATQAAAGGHSYALAYVNTAHTAPGTQLNVTNGAQTISATVEDTEVC